MRTSTPTVLVVAAIGTAVIALHSPAVHSQPASLGAAYGTREPTMCASMTEPKKGPPSNSQALQYVKCTMEHESGSNLYLLQDVTVQVAPKGRPYNPRAPISNVDTDSPIYDIRGSYVKFQCDKPDATILMNVGKSCTTYDQPKAEGICWKTTFGDWGCNMVDFNNRRQTRGVAPPR